MKKLFMYMALALMPAMNIMAQETTEDPVPVRASIKFDTLAVNLGTFSEGDDEQRCVFKFTNVGNAPLIINQAVASCGCTVPTYTKKPIRPGEKGEIKVTYNGAGKFPGHFKKTITVRTNGEPEMTRLYIEGTMEE